MAIATKFSHLYDKAVEAEFNQLARSIRAFLSKEHNEDGTHVTNNPTAGVAAATLAYVTIGNTADLSAERSLVGTSNQVAVTDNGANSTVVLSTPQDINVGASPEFLALNLGGAAAAATACRQFTKKITGIADNTATDILTVTIPNANHAATIRLLFLSSNGSTDAFESSRCASGMVIVARTTGVNAVVTAVAIADAAIATVAAGATHLLTYGVSAVTGAVGASNSFTIQVTIDDSGNLGSNQLVCFVELLNAQSTGISIV